MINPIVVRVPRIEGVLSVLLKPGDSGSRAVIESGQSTHLSLRLRNRYPLEAPQLTQSLSSSSSVAHAVASVSALEDYLHLYPTETGLRIRQVMLDLAAIRSHIYHFYWHLLPGYLNTEHMALFPHSERWFYSDVVIKSPDQKDLRPEVAFQFIQNVGKAAAAIDLLQKTIALFGGKFPVVMNQIPGGISNFSINRSLNMKAIRNLEQCKPFIEEIWPQDVRELIANTPDMVKVLSTRMNLISFGTSVIERNKGRTSNYSEGVLLNGKLEPVNELKITELIDNTFYLRLDKEGFETATSYDFNKPDARTWIKGARYDGQPMLTGAFSRMMVTHLAGGNLEISDKISQMVEDLELDMDSANCIASRLLSQLIESRIYLKNIFRNLFDIDSEQDTNRKTRFDFSADGVGVGKIESPAGSLLHQVYIKDNRIEHYRIVTSMNWNFAPMDSHGDSGEVEKELNSLLTSEGLTPVSTNRLLHAYYPVTLDGTQ